MTQIFYELGFGIGAASDGSIRLTRRTLLESVCYLRMARARAVPSPRPGVRPEPNSLQKNLCKSVKSVVKPLLSYRVQASLSISSTIRSTAPLGSVEAVIGRPITR
jgi:hypothetical protein